MELESRPRKVNEGGGSRHYKLRHVPILRLNRPFKLEQKHSGVDDIQTPRSKAYLYSPPFSLLSDHCSSAKYPVKLTQCVLPWWSRTVFFTRPYTIRIMIIIIIILRHFSCEESSVRVHLRLWHLR